MNAKEGDIVDHINHNPLDNRKINLRITNYQGNNINRTIKNKESEFAGVHYNSKRNIWVAQIKINNKTIHLIADKDKEKVEIVRLKAEQIIFGDFSPNSNRYYLLEKYDELKNINTIKELKEYFNVRNRSGVENPNAKFSKENVINIKKLYKDGNTACKIAKLYNVSISTISRLVKGITYKEVI